jgi:hypothetical protein
LNFEVLEASYQQYKGRVNFLWVYGSEAHPEENPFEEGYESVDLGWDHPYSITHTMEERAERAKWMKTDEDPDFEIPMAIDFVGHDTQPDDEIRRNYLGGGYYSCYVIDCDGIVLQRHPWGWFAPGGEWWGLPLAPIADLHDFLDDYLADPPPCYDQDGDGGTGTGDDGGTDTGDDGGTSDDGESGDDGGDGDGSGTGGGSGDDGADDGADDGGGDDGGLDEGDGDEESKGCACAAARGSSTGSLSLAVLIVVLGTRRKQRNAH